MRKIIVTTFMTMDGVLQSPGGPDEDRTGGFEWGGWQFTYADAISGQAIAKIMSEPFDLLLGRRTYEIFAAHWPYLDDEIARKFNRTNKYVVSTTLETLSWKNSTLIGSKVVDALKALKEEDGPDLLVHGSSRLVQTLFANQLVDVLHIWTNPLTLGKGKRLFAEGTPVQEWTLADAKISTTGVIMATYLPGGDVHPGSYVPLEPSQAELERREKWKTGG
ncbi:riboflavin biosynthesis protein RibD [Pedobacter yulinensis]|uniref:Riboflavin biosynthesis protein RibD n=1 Tax=Pedobacter yulinensis TaxID=2126353 RepID=A0A2T3HPB8_9SPHI|nr:dihydrofolate reductase family protein [Pedobacter yulinensis]PST84298.1 riboflavin biosynthesis protein RibD [Pedobacter yulinensis]